MPPETTSDENPSTQRNFLDRALQDTLRKPANLRSIAAEFIPSEIDRLDFENMQPVERRSFVGNLRGREADIFFKVPYRGPDPEAHMFVSILLEHQSSSDYTIPVRTLLYTSLYWEKELDLWERQKIKSKSFRLTPVLPIVLYTSKQKWGKFRSLEDLLGPPDAFHQFAPKWKPLYWELTNHPEEMLLNSTDAFLQTIAILHAEDEQFDVAEPLFRKIMDGLESFRSSDGMRWKDMIKFLFSWIQNRRPKEELPSWQQLAQTIPTREESRKELADMGLTIEQYFRSEGKAEGEKIGEARGETQGEIKNARRLLLRIGTKRFGAPSPEIAEKIQANENVDLLSDLAESLVDCDSWEVIAAKL